MKKFAHESTFLQLAMHDSQNFSRNIASAATPARDEKVDPWGHPYRMDTVKNTYGQPMFFVIWSPGPNGVIETTKTQPKIQSGRVQLSLIGDDLGYAIALK